ncbi:MAG: non-homologous end-joining DNA ligase [Gemmatimonadaceae bacterium]|nr:non-homologous end-joining DNA ligase [Gemmatimonadaceae bacterium]
MTPRSSMTPSAIESQLAAIERGPGEGTLDLGRGASLHVSSLGKVYFPKAKLTKGALMRYYARVSPVLLPHLAGRPLVLKRYPDGVGGPMFFQQDAGAHVPDVVQTEMLQTEDKGKRRRIIGGDLATLLYTVQLGAIEVHPWLSRVADIDSADRCLIDLDPGADVPFSAVVALARDVLRITEECGLAAAVKTSGSRGLHLVIALPKRTTYETSARLAMQIAQLVVAARPEVATVERSIKARPAGTIYVDALQNARGKSAASAYSVRAKEEATVSAPIAARELTGRLCMGAFTVKTMSRRVAAVGDPFGEVLAEHPTTTRVLSRALVVLDTALSAATPRRTRTRS